MAAHVISLDSYRMAHALESQLRRSLEQQAHDKVLERLRGKVTGMVMAQAQARAARLVSAGAKFQDAIHRACAWALYADKPDGAA